MILIYHAGSGTFIDPNEVTVIEVPEHLLDVLQAIADDDEAALLNSAQGRWQLCQDDLNYMLHVSYTPQAIRDHYEDREDALEGLSDDDLRQVGVFAVENDMTWSTYEDALDDARMEVEKMKEQQKAQADE